MTRKIKAQLGSLESEIMKIIWVADTPVTVRMVLDELCKKHPCAYTTVMTVMNRLEKKGILKCQRKKGHNYYEAVVCREAFARSRSKSVLNQLVSDYGNTAVEECEKFLKHKKVKTNG